MRDILKILVVEDDPLVRMLVQKQLARLGMQVEAVATGEEAVTYDKTRLGLVFMDIGLPGIDGVRATLLIREAETKENGRRIPIVAFTAHSDKQRCLSAGMDDFLQKPALLADLKRMLDKWL